MAVTGLQKTLFSLAIGAFLLAPVIADSAETASPKLIRLPLVMQHTPVHCGPAAMQSIFSYYGIDLFQEDIGKAMGTSPEYGTPIKNMVRMAKSKGFGVKLHEGLTREKLQKILDLKHPVILVLQAWAGDNPDWENTWDSGHYVVAIGYDSRRVYFMDPLVSASYAWMPWGELPKRWHDEGVDGVIKGGGIEFIPGPSMKFPPPEFVRLK
jgi:ABC-type bacteriocin/lantibiotic exporter with double-glycine peptidase domain